MRLSTRVIPAVAALAIATFVPASADAAVITWELNCVLSGAGCADSQSLGTITLEDTDTDEVTVTVDYSGSGELKDSAYLNLDADYSDIDVSGDDVTGGGGDFNYDPDNIKADGYSGFFDLEILFNNSLFEPYEAIVTATGLSTSSFNVLDTDDLLFAAAHVQSGVDSETGEDCSIWMGSKGGDPNSELDPPDCGPGGGDGPEEGPGPEPASLALLGVGMVAVGARMRRARA